MSLVFRNALMPSENQQVLRLRLVYFMRRFLLIALGMGFLLPTAARANPYQMGMQWCQMVRSGMDAAQSWRMIKDAYINGYPINMKSQRSDPYAPWYDRSISGRMGDAIGAGITSGIMAAQQLNTWAPDIIRTTDANCPEYGLYFESRAERRRRIRREKGLPDLPQQKITSPMDMD